MRYLPFVLICILTIVALVLSVTSSGWFLLLAAALGGLSALGVWDLVQPRHSILRNYPVIGHMRYLLESIRPELHQYYIESDTDGRPFSREQRALIYERSKGLGGLDAFGSELDFDAPGYMWLQHSMAATHLEDRDLRVTIGGRDCTQPYSSSLFNISAMSFGSLSPTAIQSMNMGAKAGGFCHNTGEGGVSRHHLQHGGDLCWQIGTGYFGCRADDGTFSLEKYRESVSHDAVKMVELKLSQGAKPGHGGVLPAAKVTEEIAEARGIPLGQSCISPPAHTAFSTPIEMCEFIGTLRDASGGKPIGIKLCVGLRSDFMAFCKAMIQTDILPDFIAVDGAEGGTGAAPAEFADNMGTPLTEGLNFVVQTLRGAGLRDRIRVGASGKIYSAATLAHCSAIGADFCTAARGFMMAVGCIQAQVCHTNHCPVGVATLDPGRFRAIDVGDKSERVRRFHEGTIRTFADLIGAMGLTSADQLTADHICRRTRVGDYRSLADELEVIDENALLNGVDHPSFTRFWNAASAESFKPVQPGRHSAHAV